MLQKLENGVLSSATLTYIAKPKPIDLLLGYNSNLSDSTLDEVISNVAESIKAITSSDTYEKFRQDNLIIE